MERILRVALRAALVGLVLVASTATQAHAQASADVLPDLNQLVPSRLEVQRARIGAKTVWRLGFDSAAGNIGAGALRLFGHRESRTATTMAVDQLVKQTTGPSRIVAGVGVMSYVVHPDHDHWHLLGFERYELRIAGAEQPLPRRDRKTGFCLGDRFPLPQRSTVAGFREVGLQVDHCGLGKPGLLSLFNGMSPGWLDRYAAHIEGQFIDITGLPAGRYELVHRVNAEGRLVEADYTNNAASVLFSLAWPSARHRPPRVRVLRRCPLSASCTPVSSTNTRRAV